MALRVSLAFALTATYRATIVERNRALFNARSRGNYDGFGRGQGDR
jgi:hypothetical protein